MSSISFPAHRPVGRALVVASVSSRNASSDVLQRLGFSCAHCDDPYAAMSELCGQPHEFGAVILSLSSVYREELSFIAAVKRRFPGIEVWLTHTDGRQAAMADAMRLGADGLLSDEGLHRIVSLPATPPPAPRSPIIQAPPLALEEPASSHSEESGPAEPVLTADELRALLQEQPSLPPSGGPSRND